MLKKLIVYLLFTSCAFAADRVSIEKFGFSIQPPDDAKRYEEKRIPDLVPDNYCYPWFYIDSRLLQFAKTPVQDKDLSTAFQRNQQRYKTAGSPFIPQDSQTILFRSGVKSIRCKYSIKNKPGTIIRFYMLNSMNELVYAHIFAPEGVPSQTVEQVIINTLKAD